MSMGDEDGVNAPKTMLWKPFNGSSLKTLADVDDNGPVTYQKMKSGQGGTTLSFNIIYQP